MAHVTQNLVGKVAAAVSRACQPNFNP